MKRTRIMMGLLAGGLLAAAATGAAGAPIWAGHESSEDGILTVHNPAAESPVPAVVGPDLRWRIGGDDDPAGTLFGLVTDVQAGPDGTSWLLDAVMCTVYQVDPAGTILRTLGREGDGPGEFRNAMSLAVLPDGAVGVVEMMPSQIVVFGADGLPRPTVPLGAGEGGRPMVQRLAVHGRSMVAGFFNMRFENGEADVRRTLAICDLDGSVRRKVLDEGEKQSGGSISISSGGDNDYVGNWALDGKGFIHVYRHAREYLIEVFGPDGEPVRRVRRDYESVRRPEAEIAAAREQRERMRERFETRTEMQVEEMANDIDEVIPRPDGSLWVLSSRGAQQAGPGCLGVFDVFDPAGRLTGQVRLEADYDPDDDQFLVRGDRLYILKEARNAPDRTFSGGGGMMMIRMSTGNGADEEEPDEEPQPYEVICYRLPDGR